MMIIAGNDDSQQESLVAEGGDLADASPNDKKGCTGLWMCWLQKTTCVVSRAALQV